METSTKKYKDNGSKKHNYLMTGIVSANYQKQGEYYMGVKILCFISNCPNRYYARKAANYMYTKYINIHGLTQKVLDGKTSDTMRKTEIIPFSDISFAVKP